MTFSGDTMESNEALRRIGKIGIVPVIRAETLEHTLQAAEALREGGIPVVEVTMTVPDAHRAIASVVREFGDSVLVGAGTVLNAADARKCIDAGAQFLVSPGLSPEVLQMGQDDGLLVIPGAFTPTEIMHALTSGAKAIKVFPCNSGGGVAHLKALRGPFPDIAFIPTGGVNAANAADYIAAGAWALGAGGELVDRTALRDGDPHRISALARQFVAAVAAARKLSPSPLAV